MTGDGLEEPVSAVRIGFFVVYRVTFSRLGLELARSVQRKLTSLSLAGRLLAAVLTVVVPLNVLLVAVMSNLTSAAREAQQASLLYSARSISAGLDAALDKFQALAEVLSRSPSVHHDDPAGFSVEARRAFQGIPGAWVLLADKDGRQLVHTGLPPDMQVPPLRHQAGIDAQRRAFETRQPVLSGVRVGPVIKSHVVTIDIPVFKNGEPFRSVAVAITPETFLPLLSGSETPKNWLVGVMDADGRFVARVPDHDATVGEFASEGWRKTRGQEGLAQFHSRDGDLIINANDVSALGGWTVGVAVKKSELAAATWRAVRLSIFGIALVSLTSLAFALFLARRIGRDVQTVGNNAAALLAGIEAKPSAIDLPELAELRASISTAIEGRKQVEAERVRGHNELAAIYDSARVGLCVLDSKLRFVRINRRLAEINGLPPEEHIGRSVRDVVPALAGQVDRIFQEILATGRGVSDVEVSGTTPAEPGRTRTWVEQWMPLKDTSGTIIGLNVSVEEITERKEAEAKLARQAERQHRLLDITHALISGAHDEREIASIVFQAIAPIMEADVCLNYRVEADGLDLVFSHGLGDGVETVLRRLEMGDAFCGTVAQSATAIAADSERIAADPKGAHVCAMGMTAYLCQPLLGPDGRVLGTFSVGSSRRSRYASEDVGFLQTVTNFMAEAWQRIDGERRLAGSERLLRNVLDGTLAFIGVLDPDGTLREANRPALLAGGLTLADVAGRKFWDCFWWSYSPEEGSRLKEAVATAARGDVVRYDAVVRMKDDTRMTIDFMLSPVSDPEGRVIYLVPSGFDISARKSAEERQQVLMRELGHRGKNLVAVIQSLVGRSLVDTRSIDDARRVLLGRLRALATTFSTLTEDGKATASLQAIVENEMQAFGGQVQIDGPAMLVSGKAAQTLALVVHELATNATKYGALCVPDGRIEVSWRIEADGEDPKLTFCWRESGGPPVLSAGLNGFGTALIQKVAGAEFKCVPEVSFASTGLIYRFTAPLAALSEQNGAGLDGVFSETQPRQLDGDRSAPS